MLRLHQSCCFNGYHFLSASLSLKINQKSSIPGIRWSFCEGLVRRRKSISLAVSSVEKESDFEVDAVKAREALRKLDEQLQSLAQKNIDPPKVRASEVNSTRDQKKEGAKYDAEISGTFLIYAASSLLILTIFYNVLFLIVIKPAIDGPEPIIEATAAKTTPLEQSQLTPRASDEP